MNVSKNTATISGVGLILGVAAGIIAFNRLSRTRARGETGRWHTVTVPVPMAELSSQGRLPGPLSLLDDIIEVSLRPAARDQGTEVSARLKHPDADTAGADLRRLHQGLLVMKQTLRQSENTTKPESIGESRRSWLNLPDLAGRHTRED